MTEIPWARRKYYRCLSHERSGRRRAALYHAATRTEARPGHHSTVDHDRHGAV